MRVFVAVEIDEAVRKIAARVSAGLAAAGLHDKDRRSIAWVSPQNLHVTLQFLGEVDSTSARALTDRLSSPFALPPFEIGVAGLGTFPPAGPPRVVWLGIREGAAQLSALYRDVGLRLEGLGFTRDPRPFHAHLTIGRVKGPLSAPFRAAMAGAGAVDAGRCLVDHVTLFESRLSPAGAVYSVVATSRLGYHHHS
jgi:RNA 2',3'-cyclic 3'-phosphodiesterase